MRWYINLCTLHTKTCAHLLGPGGSVLAEGRGGGTPQCCAVLGHLLAPGLGLGPPCVTTPLQEGPQASRLIVGAEGSQVVARPSDALCSAEPSL